MSKIFKIKRVSDSSNTCTFLNKFEKTPSVSLFYYEKNFLYDHASFYCWINID